MPRHPEVLTDLPNCAADYRLETPQPDRIPGSSLSRAVYIHQETQERWLAKSPVQQETLITRRFLLREDSLRKHLWSGLLGMVMKHIFDRDVLPVLKELVTWMKDLERQDGREFIHSLWYYIYKKGSIRDEAELKTLIIEQLPDTAGEEVMATLAQIHLERGRQEGWQKGKFEGREEGKLDGERLLLKRLIERRFGALPPHYAEKIAAAQEDELMLWSERIFQAKQVQAIFEENSSLKN